MLLHIQDQTSDLTSFLGRCQDYFISPLVGIDINICPREGQWYKALLLLSFIQYDNNPYEGQETLHIGSLQTSITSLGFLARKRLPFNSFIQFAKVRNELDCTILLWNDNVGDPSFGMIRVGDPHSERFIFLMTPILHSRSTSILNEASCIFGIGYAHA
jgi:hypothetical protein